MTDLVSQRRELRSTSTRLWAPCRRSPAGTTRPDANLVGPRSSHRRALRQGGRATIVEPTIVHDYTRRSRRLRDPPRRRPLVERFEVVNLRDGAGQRLSELNDPIEPRGRFDGLAQARGAR